MSSVTASVVGPVEISTPAASVSVAFVVSAVLAKSRTVLLFASAGSLTRLTTTLRLLTVAVRPVMPVKLAVSTSAFSAVYFTSSVVAGVLLSSVTSRMPKSTPERVKPISPTPANALSTWPPTSR